MRNLVKLVLNRIPEGIRELRLEVDNFHFIVQNSNLNVVKDCGIYYYGKDKEGRVIHGVVRLGEYLRRMQPNTRNYLINTCRNIACDVIDYFECKGLEVSLTVNPK